MTHDNRQLFVKAEEEENTNKQVECWISITYSKLLARTISETIPKIFVNAKFEQLAFQGSLYLE